jgi:hypothetical protein
MPWSAHNNRRPTRWVLWKDATAGAFPQAIIHISLKKTPTVLTRTTRISRDGTTDSTAVSPVKERLPIIIITKAITVIITPIPFTQGFTIPVIIMPPVTPSGWATMDTPTTAPMSTAMIITTPTGTAGANTGAVIEDTAETIMLGNIVVEAVVVEVMVEGAAVVEAMVAEAMVAEAMVVEAMVAEAMVVEATGVGAIKGGGSWTH